MDNIHNIGGNEDDQVIDPLAGKKRFVYHGRTYAVMIERMNWKKKIITSDDIVASPQLQAELVALAWEGPDGRREEEEFHLCTILAIDFGADDDGEEFEEQTTTTQPAFSPEDIQRYLDSLKKEEPVEPDPNKQASEQV